MRHLLRVLTLVCLIITSQATYAGPDEDRAQAEKLVQNGLVDARAGRYRDAVSKFEAAFKLYPRPEIEHNLARAYEELKEYKQAYTHFSKALEQDYTFADDGRKRLAAIEEILRKNHAWVRVTATPSQVRLVLHFADGTEETHTSTPLETWAPAGTLEVSASNPKFESLTERRELDAGSVTDLDMVLKPISKRGFIEVTVSQPDAHISLSGQPVGKSPLGPQLWNAGTYTLEVTREGYRTETQTVTIVADQVTTVNVALEAASSVATDEDGASIPWVGWTLGGVGVATGITAVIFQFGKALPLERESNSHKNDPDPTVQNRLLDRAYTWETAAIVTGITSAALIGTGVYLILTHEDTPTSGSTSTTFVPTMSLSPSAALLGGVLRF